MPPPCATTSDAQSTSAQNQRLVNLNEYRIILMQMNKLIHAHDGIKYLSHSLSCFLFHARPFLSLSLLLSFSRTSFSFLFSLSLCIHAHLHLCVYTKSAHRLFFVSFFHDLSLYTCRYTLHTIIFYYEESKKKKFIFQLQLIFF